MALIEQKQIDRTEVIGQFKHIQVRERIDIIDDVTNEIKATTFHRHVLSPGDDIANESQEIQDIANTVWTQTVIDSYIAFQATQTI